MDLIKSCTSNVLQLDLSGKRDLIAYEWKPSADLDDSDQCTLRYGILTYLRDANILCTEAHGQLHIYGHLANEQREWLKNQDRGLNLAQVGPSETDSATVFSNLMSSAGLLEALQYQVAWNLYRSQGIQQIGKWTWILLDQSDDHGGDGSVTIRVKPRITPAGHTQLAFQSTSSALATRPAESMTRPGTGVLAPSGQHFKYDPQVKPTSDENTIWKALVTASLISRGFRIGELEEWCTVQISYDQKNQSISWPKRLCLFDEFMGASDENMKIEEDSLNADDHSVDKGLSSYQDPFAFAETWFNNTGTREAQQLSQALNSRTDNTLAALQALISQAMTSPAATQHYNDQLSSSQTVYPTPPAGITQIVPPSQASLPTAFSDNLHDEATPASVMLPDATPSQQPQSDPNPPASSELDHIDLFDGSGEIEFDEHAIDDADFSFFDEPDDAVGDPNLPDSDFMNTTAEGEQLAEPKSESQPPQTETMTLDPPIVALTQDSAAQGVSQVAGSGQEQSNNVDEVAVHHESDAQAARIEKPLSPFGIRERILPPPVPASISMTGNRQDSGLERSNSFAPVLFNETFNLSNKYANHEQVSIRQEDGSKYKAIPNINLPRSRISSTEPQSSDETSDSDDDLGMPMTPDNAGSVPPKLPWNTRKRKRDIDMSAAATPSQLSVTWANDRGVNDDTLAYIPQDVIDTVERILLPATPNDFDNGIQPARGRSIARSSYEDGIIDIPSSLLIDDLYDFSEQELVSIAQLISEQSLTCSWLRGDDDELESDSTANRSVSNLDRYTQNSLLSALQIICSSADLCDVQKLALMKEPLSRVPSAAMRGPQGQPRPLVRAETGISGPDIFSIPPPFVRTSRGPDTLELLPTCLPFWEPLAIGPANGVKDVAALCVFPGSDDTRIACERFIKDIGVAYENCKLGSHILGRFREARDGSGHGMIPIHLNGQSNAEIALQTIADVMRSLGRKIGSHISAKEASTSTIVIYVVNPFRGPTVVQHLCACLWMFFASYRDAVSKAKHNASAPDIVFQILPLATVAPADSLAMLDAQMLAAIAREVYDRVPPMTIERDSPQTLPIYMAPWLELASAAPKRIGFQLTSDPPGDLLHEGSVLHLAYNISDDGQWLNAAWTDSTGRYTATTSFCACGRTLPELLSEVYDRTNSIMSARPVTWRLLIASDQQPSQLLQQIWRTIFVKARKQTVAITLLSVQTEPVVRLLSPDSTLDQNISASDQGLPTPGSTPQATGLVNSPDVSGYGGNAPLTPAPSEVAISMAENDADAQMVDTADESWGIIYSSAVGDLLGRSALANGCILKRGGDSEDLDDSTLPALEVSLHWTVQVKTSGNVDEGTTKHAEVILRDVLRSYRNLAVLTKAKALEGTSKAIIPLHVAMAKRGAESLNGMLGHA